MTLNDLELNEHCLLAKDAALETQKLQRDNDRTKLKKAIETCVAHGSAALKRLNEL